MDKIIIAVLGTVCAVSSVMANAKSSAASQGIVMEVVELESDSGFVHCHLYDAPKGFPTQPELAAKKVKVRPMAGRAVCRFGDLPPGRYAVSFWHDVDNDNVMDSNFLGIPKEPVGASNNAQGRFGPPKFKKAAFEYRGGVTRQRIRLD